MDNYITSERFEAFLSEEKEHHQRDEAAMNRIADDQAKMKKTLYGNGDPGWDEMIRELWRDLQERKQDKKDAEKALKESEKEAQKAKKAEVSKYVFWAVTFVIANAVSIGLAVLAVGK